MTQKLPVFAIVGRPNVGKSTLFNNLLREQKAIVEDTPGVTRDRIYAKVEQFSVPFIIIDTGGFAGPEEIELRRLVWQQAELAIEEADILFVIFDGQSGLHPDDEIILDLVRRCGKKAYYLVNKCDGKEQIGRVADFYSLGIEELKDISAREGRNVKLMIEEILSKLPNYSALRASAKAREEEEKRALEDATKIKSKYRALKMEVAEVEDQAAVIIEQRLANDSPAFAPVYYGDDPAMQQSLKLDSVVARDRIKRVSSEESFEDITDEMHEEPDVIEIENIDCIKVAIVGRPNVGKSTLLNRFTGSERAITSDIAGTTRDSLDVEITRNKQLFKFVDTAGIRRKSKVGEDLERLSVLRALGAINESDVVVVVIDAERGPEEQDAKLIGMAHEQGRGIVIVVNKWDLLKKDHKTVKQYGEKIRAAFKFAPYAPIVFVSALTGKRCPRIVEVVKEVAYSRQRRISTNRLNRILKVAVQKHTLPVYRGRPVKLYYASQVAVAPPRFVIFVNQPQGIHFSNIRYLKNSIRKFVEFDGTDIKIVVRKK